MLGHQTPDGGPSPPYMSDRRRSWGATANEGPRGLKPAALCCRTIADGHSVGRPAFTLIELLIVIVILAICYGLALPTLGNSKTLRLREAARMLAADLELAQTESITHSDNPRIVKFDTVNQRYWIAPASTPDTPITDPVSNQPFLVAFGTGRASAATGVTIQAISLGGDREIHFNPYGSPDQSTNATVTLACGTATMTVQVETGTGEVTVTSP